jgi:hypothetical protein
MAQLVLGQPRFAKAGVGSVMESQPH